MTTLRVLIVDDEPLARRRLRALLATEPGVRVVAEAEEGRAAIAEVRRRSPDLMLLDVQMPGMTGFDVIAALDPSECPAVIFVTAYEKYALRAFDVHAIDYLLKPFDRARLRRALDRARALIVEGGGVARRLSALLADVAAAQPGERLAVKAAGRVYFVRVEDIDWIEAAGHYLCVHVGAESHVIRDTIAAVERRLDVRRFLRVHRSAIVNVDRIKEIQSSFGGEHTLVLRSGARVASSRGYAHVLRSLLA